MRKTSLNCVFDLAKKDDRVVFIGSDLGVGVLSEMKAEFPDRFFMEGIAEQHVIGMAAGLAMEGYIPYVNTIATFLTRRCFEQVAVDLCIHNLPVRLIANGGGTVYAPLGPTHLAIEDISIMRSLPNMTIVAPCDAEEMKRLMVQSLDWPSPLYIRLAKGYDSVVSRPELGFELGKAILMEPPGEVLLISTGIMTQRALKVKELLETDQVNCGVLHVHTIKPLDSESILKYCQGRRLIVTLEENTVIGGLGSAVAETLIDLADFSIPKILRLGLPDQFAKEYGSQNSLLETYGLSPDKIVQSINQVLKKEFAL